MLSEAREEMAKATASHESAVSALREYREAVSSLHALATATKAGVAAEAEAALLRTPSDAVHPHSAAFALDSQQDGLSASLGPALPAPSAGSVATAKYQYAHAQV